MGRDIVWQIVSGAGGLLFFGYNVATSTKRRTWGTVGRGLALGAVAFASIVLIVEGVPPWTDYPRPEIIAIATASATWAYIGFMTGLRYSLPPQSRDLQS